MGDVVAFVNLRISEGHLRQLLLTQGQRGLCAARRTAMTETRPSLSMPREHLIRAARVRLCPHPGVMGFVGLRLLVLASQPIL